MPTVAEAMEIMIKRYNFYHATLVAVSGSCSEATLLSEIRTLDEIFNKDIKVKDLPVLIENLSKPMRFVREDYYYQEYWHLKILYLTKLGQLIIEFNKELCSESLNELLTMINREFEKMDPFAHLTMGKDISIFMADNHEKYYYDPETGVFSAHEEMEDEELDYLKSIFTDIKDQAELDRVAQRSQMKFAPCFHRTKQLFNQAMRLLQKIVK